MVNKKWYTLLIVCLIFLPSEIFSQKAKIRIIATGGTIAGIGNAANESTYKAGELGVYQLLNAVPQIKEIAEVSGEQLVKIGSQDMNDEVWLSLANRINELLEKEEYDGVVVTHGTDTMEETSYFLNLTIHSNKPVVLVGAMRPSTALSADGPLNLYNAVQVASSSEARNRGVMVVMNDLIFDAKDVSKTNTTNVDAFQAFNFGVLGYVHNGKTYFHRNVTNKHTIQSPFDISKLKKLPQVGIVYGYANASDLPIKAFIKAKYDGIVHAGVGNGNFYHTVFEQAVEARKKNIIIVRSSRVPSGSTTPNGEIDDIKYGFVVSHTLNPQKARILLMLSLTKTNDWKEIQKYFDQY